ncbi:peptidyl-prolyl cis-trans isomerase B (cyclophilin B) [Halopelagius inordinatus]|uniref:Peptidyl-prolyl cis-trans isomerase n=1 Tax=Halopelagius inordinatus TaxID=553467 RepID=A0A1I2VQM2_9EURY|nr:peptidylprolyl isomerase [Halopelagius inordinatus]SFG91614.1 peptidyl-prolyl cis-trans isomerase B (cyclophilin B) [Halopelagius inordinatus]
MAIEPGDRVTIEYVGRFEDGSVFDTSDYEVAEESGLLGARGEDRTDYAPLSFTVGDGTVIEGLAEGLVGLDAGAETTVSVPPEKAYGEFDADRVRTYDAESFEGMVGQSPEVGLHVHAENGLHGDVTAVRDDAVEVDFNHELAGKTLVFDVEIVEVR